MEISKVLMLEWVTIINVIYGNTCINYRCVVLHWIVKIYHERSSIFEYEE